MADAINEFAGSIKLLMGDRSEAFDGECALRMFQFQTWLLSTGPKLKDDVSEIQYDKSFLRGARIFTTAFTGDVASKLRSRAQSLSASDQFLLAFASQPLRELVDRYFKRPASFQSLLRIDNFPLRKSDYSSAFEKIERLNVLVSIRMRLAHGNHSSSLNSGLTVYEKLETSRLARTTISPIHRERRQRQPFLFAASVVAPQYLTIDFGESRTTNPFLSADLLISQMYKKSREITAFRALCGAAKAVALEIEPSILPDLKDVWSALEPDLESLKLTPIPAEYIERPAPRRAAPETKKARRRLPSQNNPT
jgi:hypothetical protein